MSAPAAGALMIGGSVAAPRTGLGAGGDPGSARRLLMVRPRPVAQAHPIDPDQHIATWRYDAVRPDPLPHWSAQRLLAIEVCNLIPYGRWCYYQDLTLAYNAVVRARDHGYTTHNAHTFRALLVDDNPDRDAGRISRDHRPVASDARHERAAA